MKPAGSVIWPTLLLIISISSSTAAYQTPTSDVGAEDMIDKQLPKMDKKIWQNFLQFYANVRMVAKTTLKEMQAISDFAWSAQRQLQSVENAAKRIEQIYNDIGNYRGDNLIDFIEFTETRVFQQTDQLIYYDVPSIGRCNRDLIADRDEIMTLGRDQARAIANASVKTYRWFEQKFFYTQKQAQADPRILYDRSPKPDQKVAQMSGTIISQNLAGADIRNQNQQNQAAMLASVAGAAGGNGGDVPVKLQTEIGKDNDRNNLILTLQENDIQNSAVTTEAWYLFLKARQLDQGIVAKSLLVACAQEFSEEVQKIRDEKR
ncbi:MAG: hypothetical protein GX556_17385 [Fibrobacter sp.]|nr:hypothetical protein [Fibrobacter sp.]